MVTVVAVADGASEPVRSDEPTSLQAARTPAIDGLLRSGVLQRAATTPAGLLPGTEVGLPTLLGVAPRRQPGRGRIEAAAAGIELASDDAAWRLDLVPHTTPDAGTLAALRAVVAAVGCRVEHLRGHRCLLIGPASWGDAPPGPHQTSGAPADMLTGRFATITAAAAGVLADGVTALPWGTVHAAWPDLPGALGRRVFVVADGGAAAGIGRLLGCDVQDSQPQRAVDVVAGAHDDDVVVVVDGGPDDAGHARDGDGKVAALERFDTQVVAPLIGLLRARGGRMIVAADHGCDPATGRHGAEPVPVVLWSSNGIDAGSRTRWTERDAQHLPAVAAETLLRECLTMASA